MLENVLLKSTEFDILKILLVLTTLKMTILIKT